MNARSRIERSGRPLPLAVLVVPLLLVALVLLPHRAEAQARSSSRTMARDCQVDTTAEWYRSQRRFYADSTDSWSDAVLRVRLLSAAAYDPATIFTPELGWRLEAATRGSVDESVLTLLRGMAQQRQWPTRSMVGVAGVHAAWLIAQHDSALTVAAMHRMMEAGPGESSPAEVAVLEDARRVQIGRGQIHGTQFRRDGARLTISGRLEDSAHVDMRREGAWLPPFAVSRCLAEAAAASRR